jgi:surface antigen
MNKRLVYSSVVALFVSTSVGCQTMGQKEGIGAVTGALLGGVVGNHFGGGSGKAVATTAGVFIGGMMGREVGAGLDRYDAQLASGTMESALEYNQNNVSSSWSNPNTSNRGYVTPTRTYPQYDTYCREYSHNMTIANKKQQVYGTACRQSDGSWKVQ